MTEVFLSVQRYDWSAPVSHPSACMLVNHGPSQQPWKWGATARYSASHTKTMLPTRKPVSQSSRQSDHMKTWPLWRNSNCSGMDVSPIHQVWPNHLCVRCGQIMLLYWQVTVVLLIAFQMSWGCTVRKVISLHWQRCCWSCFRCGPDVWGGFAIVLTSYSDIVGCVTYGGWVYWEILSLYRQQYSYVSGRQILRKGYVISADSDIAGCVSDGLLYEEAMSWYQQVTLMLVVVFQMGTWCLAWCVFGLCNCTSKWHWCWWLCFRWGLDVWLGVCLGYVIVPASGIDVGGCVSDVDLLWGGNVKDHAVAQEDSWQRILQFFQKHLPPSPQETTVRNWGHYIRFDACSWSTQRIVLKLNMDMYWRKQRSTFTLDIVIFIILLL